MLARAYRSNSTNWDTRKRTHTSNTCAYNYIEAFAFDPNTNMCAQTHANHNHKYANQHNLTQIQHARKKRQKPKEDEGVRSLRFVIAC